jgi:glycosyltransferase involved in cell wall biosynthesis
MSKLPQVTVIIPYRENRGYLQLAIQSVKTQTYEGDIQLLEMKSNNTVGENLNNGIVLATGDYITYLCDDDLLPANAIADSVATFIAEPNADFIHGMAHNFLPDGSYALHRPAVLRPKIGDLLKRNHIHGGTVMYRASFFEKYGKYNASLLTGEEFEMHLRALHRGAVMGYCDSVLYHYRMHGLQKHKRHILPNGERREDHINRFKNLYR